MEGLADSEHEFFSVRDGSASRVGTCCISEGNFLTSSNIIALCKISEVWLACGGEPPKNGRARAFHRGGDNPSAVSLDDEKGCWFDHRDGVGGGVLDLVQHLRGGDRLSALRWLAEFLGVAVEDRVLEPAERRERALRFAQAKREATDLIIWKQGCLDALKRERDRWWAIYHASLRYLLDVGFDAPLSDAAVVLHDLAEVQVGIWNLKTELLKITAYPVILQTFRGAKARRVA